MVSKTSCVLVVSKLSKEERIHQNIQILLDGWEKTERERSRDKNEGRKGLCLMAELLKGKELGQNGITESQLPR